MHHLTRTATPGTLHDPDGQVFARLGVDGAAQYLIRPDNHIGYRCGGRRPGRVAALPHPLAPHHTTASLSK